MARVQKQVHPCSGFVGAQVRFFRQKKGMTQSELSRCAGIKYRHYQEIEAGRVDIKIRTLGAIAVALEITPQRLLTPHPETRKFLCSHCSNL